MVDFRGCRWLTCCAAMLLLAACASKPVHHHAPKAKPVVPFVEQGDIQLVWQHDVDQRKPASPPGFSLPAAFTTDHGELIVAGGRDRRVRFYDAQGRELGWVALQYACESGALRLRNGIVVVGDVLGNLYGIDPERQQIVWQQPLSAAMMGAPVAIGDDFIVQTSNNLIYRLHADGKKVWSYSASRLGGLGMHMSPSPVVYQGRVYAVFSNGDVIALKGDTGSLLWKRQLLISNDAAVVSELKVPEATPLVLPAGQTVSHEDILAVAIYQGSLFFLSLRDGSTLARRGLSVKGRPAMAHGELIVADASGAVSALDVEGTTLWKKQLSSGELTAPVVWQGKIWVADALGHVFRLALDGTLQSAHALNGRFDREPVLSRHGVLLRNNLGTLYLLR